MKVPAWDPVLKESLELGTRSVTINLQGFPTLRLHLEPEQAAVSGLTVFLAHASADREWADAVHDLLRGVGFNVTYLRDGRALTPAGAPELSPEQLRQRLGESIRQADYLCMLLSSRSADRDWVRFELAYASQVIGRALVVLEKGITDTAFMNWPSFAQRAMLTARYTVIEYDDHDPELGLRLGRALINDPDEGVTDGGSRPLVIRERNLRRENRLRQYFRVFLETVDEYAQRHVVDVLPFTWEECGVASGDVRGVIQWFYRNHGRYNLLVQVDLRRWQVSMIEAPATEAISDLVSTPTAHALVLWTPEWDSDDETPNRVWWQDSQSKPQFSMKLTGDRS